MFEQKEYTEVDLSGLDALTVKDAIEVQKQLFGQQEVAASLLTETLFARGGLYGWMLHKGADSCQHILSVDDVLLVELVDLQHNRTVHFHKASEVEGAGMLGVLDSPTIGQFESMEQEVKFNGYR